MSYLDEIRERGPRTFDDVGAVKNAFTCAISNALVSSNLEEQQLWLAEADRWRRFLPECLLLTEAEIRRLRHEAPRFIVCAGSLEPFVEPREICRSCGGTGSEPRRAV